MRQSACFSLTNINENKIKSEHGSHIRIHTTYNSIMFTYNICKPDDNCRVNTDLPPLRSGEHKINNTEWATIPENDSMDRNYKYNWDEMIKCFFMLMNIE